MTAGVGRDVEFEWGATPVTGVREKGITCNGTPIDVTDGDDAGWRTLLAVAGQNEVNVSLAGVTKDAALRTAFLSGARTQAVTITYPGTAVEGGGTLSGSFFLSSYSEGMPYNDARTFTAELVSSGAVTFTPTP